MSIEPESIARASEPMGLIARLIDAAARRRFIVFLLAGGLTLWGLWSAQRTQLDALPDLSDTQVIVATEWMGRSPTLIENQVSYPIVTTFLGAPNIKTVRGFTMFGMSFVYVVFQDGTDLYWARSRVVEYLAKVKDKLPEGVTPQIGPDATSFGWVFQYALVAESGRHNLQELRSFQDWYLRYWLQGLEGVAEVASLGGSLPSGTRVVAVYDRSQLIKDSISTLSTNLLQILAVVIAIIFLFLFHFRSALVAAIALPTATAATFVTFYYLDISINIMSLAGVILALGDMVDSACVLVENAHKKIAEAERAGGKVDRKEVVVGAARELGPSMFGALLVLTIAFLPVFALQGEEGRLFRPLALSRTFSMAFASIFAVTLVPALMVSLLKGKIRPEERNPLNRLCIAAYRPILRLCLKGRYVVIALVLAIMGATVYPFAQLGSEFMPPLYEEDLLYMPITVPGIAVAEARRLLQWQDQQIRSVPEVERVLGKAGRAESSLDPAPLSMFETIVRLKPPEQWRPGITLERIIAELSAKTESPGVQGAWTAPIKARIDMLSTGIHTPIGIKVFGPDLEVISRINDQLERVLRPLPNTRSVYAERELGGFFLDVTPNREAIARYGLTVRDVLDLVESSIGGMDVASTYEGRERYRINVRYPRELRDNLEAIRDVLVPIALLSPRPLPVGAVIAGGGMGSGAQSTGPMPAQSPASGGGMEGGMSSGMATGGPSTSNSGGGAMDSQGMPSAGSASRVTSPGLNAAFVPLGQLARIETVMGPSMIKSEMGSITGWVYVDIDTSDVGGYVRFAAVGAIWTLWLAHFNTSIAVWVGMIALLGVASETASVMVVYLDDAWNAGRTNGTLTTVSDLVAGSLEVATKRVRPMLMTVMTNVFGLLPILLDTGVGSDVAKRIAAPMWGGLVSLSVLTLLVIPAVYVVWRTFQLAERTANAGGTSASEGP